VRLILAALLAALAVACAERPAPSPTPAASPNVASPATATATPPPTPTATPPPRPPLPPAPLPTPDSTGAGEEKTTTFHVGPGVEPGDDGIVRYAIELTRAFLRRHAGEDIAPVTVLVYRDIESLAQAYAAYTPERAGPTAELKRRLAFGVAEAAYRSVFLFTGSAYWRRLPAAHQLRIPAHEYFHVIQLELIGEERAERLFQTPVAEEREEGPTWRFEGGAEWVSWHVVAEAGFVDFRSHIAEEASAARSRSIALSEVETFLEYALGGAEGVATSFLAVDYLLRGRAVYDLLLYYHAVGAGLSWQAAFELAFARSPAAFYAEFESYRARGFP
jgi:hypothetical protein